MECIDHDVLSLGNIVSTDICGVISFWGIKLCAEVINCSNILGGGVISSLWV